MNNSAEFSVRFNRGIFGVYALYFIVFLILRFIICDMRFAFYNLQFMIYDLRFMIQDRDREFQRLGLKFHDQRRTRIRDVA